MNLHEEILKLFMVNPSISTAEITKAIGIGEYTIKRVIKSLKNLGQIDENNNIITEIKEVIEEIIETKKNTPEQLSLF